LEKYIGILGAIGSVIGAFFTFWQCKIAVKAKNETIGIRDQLKKKYLDYELSQLRPKISFVVNQLTKYTINSPTSKRGLKIDDDLQHLKKLLNEIRSNDIYTVLEVRTNVDRITNELQILSTENNYSKNIDDINIYLTHISREFDKTIKKDN